MKMGKSTPDPIHGMKQDMSNFDLLSFLVAEFADAGLAGKSDEEIAQSCVHAPLADWHRGIIAEGRVLLNTSNFPWEQIGDYANRYFETETEAREWLANVLEALDEGVRETPKRDPCS